MGFIFSTTCHTILLPKTDKESHVRFILWVLSCLGPKSILKHKAAICRDQLCFKRKLVSPPYYHDQLLVLWSIVCITAGNTLPAAVFYSPQQTFASSLSSVLLTAAIDPFPCNATWSVLCHAIWESNKLWIWWLQKLRFYVIKKSLCRHSAYPREKHAESHNTAHHSNFAQRNPVHFLVIQLTIRCPNQNKTDGYIVKITLTKRQHTKSILSTPMPLW